jgi:hypothetical protein
VSLVRFTSPAAIASCHPSDNSTRHADAPTLRLPEGVRPVSYAADLTLLPDSPAFRATMDIDVTFASLFYLNARGLEIRKNLGRPACFH